MINGDNHEYHAGDHGVGHLLERCAALVTGMARLPAVPTPDWCDQAARTLVAIGPELLAVVGIVRCDGAGRLVQLAAAGVGSNIPHTEGLDRLSHLRLAVEQLVATRFERAQILMAEGAPRSGVLTLATSSESVGRWAECLKGLSATGGDPRGVIWSTSILSPIDRSIGLLALVIPSRDEDLSEPNRVLLQTGASTLAKIAFHAIHATSRPGPSGRIGEVQWLTPREQDVLELLVEGKSVREIGDELSRSPHTVHDYVKSLHRKLGASSRGELVARVLGHVRSDAQ
jgi:DNA-binding CsgD family transcriptional regulator